MVAPAHVRLMLSILRDNIGGRPPQRSTMTVAGASDSPGASSPCQPYLPPKASDRVVLIAKGTSDRADSDIAANGSGHKRSPADATLSSPILMTVQLDRVQISLADRGGHSLSSAVMRLSASDFQFTLEQHAAGSSVMGVTLRRLEIDDVRSHVSADIVSQRGRTIVRQYAPALEKDAHDLVRLELFTSEVGTRKLTGHLDRLWVDWRPEFVQLLSNIAIASSLKAEDIRTEASSHRQPVSAAASRTGDEGSLTSQNGADALDAELTMAGITLSLLSTRSVSRGDERKEEEFELAQFVASDAKFLLRQSAISTSIRGELGDVSLKAADAWAGRALLTQRAGHSGVLLLFEYERFAHDHPRRIARGEDGRFTAELSALSFVFVQPQVLELQAYLMDGVLGSLLSEAGKNAAAALESVANSGSHITSRIVISEPQFVIPRSWYSGPDEFILVTTTSLSSDHTNERDRSMNGVVEVKQLHVYDAQGASIVHLDLPVETQSLGVQWEMSTPGSRALGRWRKVEVGGGDVGSETRVIGAFASLSPTSVMVAAAHVRLLLSILRDNIGGHPPQRSTTITIAAASGLETINSVETPTATPMLLKAHFARVSLTLASSNADSLVPTEHTPFVRLSAFDLHASFEQTSGGESLISCTLHRINADDLVPSRAAHEIIAPCSASEVDDFASLQLITAKERVNVDFSITGLRIFIVLHLVSDLAHFSKDCSVIAATVPAPSSSSTIGIMERAAVAPARISPTKKAIITMTMRRCVFLLPVDSSSATSAAMLFVASHIDANVVHCATGGLSQHVKGERVEIARVIDMSQESVSTLQFCELESLVVDLHSALKETNRHISLEVSLAHIITTLSFQDLKLAHTLVRSVSEWLAEYSGLVRSETAGPYPQQRPTVDFMVSVTGQSVTDIVDDRGARDNGLWRCESNRIGCFGTFSPAHQACTFTNDFRLYCYDDLQWHSSTSKHALEVAFEDGKFDVRMDNVEFTLSQAVLRAGMSTSGFVRDFNQKIDHLAHSEPFAVRNLTGVDLNFVVARRSHHVGRGETKGFHFGHLSHSGVATRRRYGAASTSRVVRVVVSGVGTADIDLDHAPVESERIHSLIGAECEVFIDGVRSPELVHCNGLRGTCLTDNLTGHGDLHLVRVRLRDGKMQDELFSAANLFSRHLVAVTRAYDEKGSGVCVVTLRSCVTLINRTTLAFNFAAVGAQGTVLAENLVCAGQDETSLPISVATDAVSMHVQPLRSGETMRPMLVRFDSSSRCRVVACGISSPCDILVGITKTINAGWPIIRVVAKAPWVVCSRIPVPVQLICQNDDGCFALWLMPHVETHVLARAGSVRLLIDDEGASTAWFAIPRVVGKVVLKLGSFSCAVSLNTALRDDGAIRTLISGALTVFDRTGLELAFPVRASRTGVGWSGQDESAWGHGWSGGESAQGNVTLLESGWSPDGQAEILTILCRGESRAVSLPLEDIPRGTYSALSFTLGTPSESGSFAISAYRDDEDEEDDDRRTVHLIPVFAMHNLTDVELCVRVQSTSIGFTLGSHSSMPLAVFTENAPTIALAQSSAALSWSQGLDLGRQIFYDVALSTDFSVSVELTRGGKRAKHMIIVRNSFGGGQPSLTSMPSSTNINRGSISVGSLRITLLALVSGGVRGSDSCSPVAAIELGHLSASAVAAPAPASARSSMVVEGSQPKMASSTCPCFVFDIRSESMKLLDLNSSTRFPCALVSEDKDDCFWLHLVLTHSLNDGDAGLLVIHDSHLHLADRFRLSTSVGFAVALKRAVMDTICASSGEISASEESSSVTTWRVELLAWRFSGTRVKYEVDLHMDRAIRRELGATRIVRLLRGVRAKLDLDAVSLRSMRPGVPALAGSPALLIDSARQYITDHVWNQGARALNPFGFAFAIDFRAFSGRNSGGATYRFGDITRGIVGSIGRGFGL